MNANDLISIAAHLHVAMRRKMGRVTDTEWMASNLAYARAMAGLAQAHARAHADEDLMKWAVRLETAWAALAPRPAAVAAGGATEPEVADRRYVVGLRC
jgi:hypothetical protein